MLFRNLITSLGLLILSLGAHASTESFCKSYAGESYVLFEKCMEQELAAKRRVEGDVSEPAYAQAPAPAKSVRNNNKSDAMKAYKFIETHCVSIGGFLTNDGMSCGMEKEARDYQQRCVALDSLNAVNYPAYPDRGLSLSDKMDEDRAAVGRAKGGATSAAGCVLAKGAFDKHIPMLEAEIKKAEKLLMK